MYSGGQAVDFIAGAIDRKYRDNDEFYYNRIQHKIAIAFDFFEQDKNGL